MRETPNNPLATTLDVLNPNGAKPSARTMQMLRRYNLDQQLGANRAALIQQVQSFATQESQHEHEYAICELAYLGAKDAEKMRREEALELYTTAILHSYQYLFDQQSGAACNPYDPQFRGACDLYNQSLEGLLRLVKQDGELNPGDRRTLKTTNHLCQLDVQLFSRGWQADDFERFEFVSDFQVNGLRNHYHTYGLGVPLIAIRRPHDNADPTDQFYPPKLAFPITAFLRVRDPNAAGADPNAPCLTLELHDPLTSPGLLVNDRSTPMESDLSTPLAFFLNYPEFQDKLISTTGLFNPEELRLRQGLYMVEPYDPNKMPVLMVHGLWSSPITWMEMFNDLRSDPAVRDRYQFWFYLYPTGQPFWASAAQMRDDLARFRNTVDPERRQPALDQMVLVGHSMGGLVSRLQTVESGQQFWAINSDRNFQELQADPDIKQCLATTYFFRPSPSVKRVVTIGTPHRGSDFANATTRWLGNALIKSPMRLMAGREQVVARNPNFFRPNAPLQIRTSIDSLAPESAVLPVLLSAQPGPWVRYHNIVGAAPNDQWYRYFASEGDGVVSLASARLEGLPQLASQITVPSDHVSVHRHPQSVLEMRRILLEQMGELDRLPFAAEGAIVTDQPEPVIRTAAQTPVEQTPATPIFAPPVRQ